MRVLGAILVATFLSPIWAQAQDEQTLADIRQELQFVYAEIVNLKRELSTTGSAAQTANNGPALQRIDALESEVRRITGSIESKQNWIERIVSDGTNRVGDLEFRLCELESGCDISNLDRTAPLGGKIPDRQGAVSTGQTSTTQTVSSAATDTSGATDSEKATFQRAMSAFEAQDFASANSQFDTLVANFPGGPLTVEAHYWKGASQAGLGDWNGAARSFLESFSGSPQGTKAPDALYRLGISLRELGQVEEACLMLSEVPIRYPSAAVLGEAAAERDALGCS
ncbi:MAG: tol-pal system protein YbgF [Amylibacter sp.]|jgi:tol-pal system protein YbgF|nr:tol-pal system protein YbgF [Amylibacter sp.]